MAKAKTPRNSAKTTDGASTIAQSTPLQTETFSEIREIRRVTPDGRKNIVPINLDDEIRRRAYELWEQRGYEPGHEDEHWLLAEREILERYGARHQHSA